MVTDTPSTIVSINNATANVYKVFYFTIHGDEEIFNTARIGSMKFVTPTA